MGLDMYVKRKLRIQSEEIAYWRKENALQGWFEENFNIENLGKVVLTEEIVDKLLKNLNEHNLEPTCGFFYGDCEKELKDEWFDEMIKEWESIKKQIQENGDKYEYYYTCWY